MSVSIFQMEIKCRLNSTPLEIALCNMMNGIQNFVLQMTIQISDFIYQNSKSQNIIAIGSLCYASLSCLHVVFSIVFHMIQSIKNMAVAYYMFLYNEYEKKETAFKLEENKTLEKNGNL